MGDTKTCHARRIGAWIGHTTSFINFGPLLLRSTTYRLDEWDLAPPKPQEFIYRNHIGILLKKSVQFYRKKYINKEKPIYLYIDFTQQCFQICVYVYPQKNWDTLHPEKCNSRIESNYFFSLTKFI